MKNLINEMTLYASYLLEELEDFTLEANERKHIYVYKNHIMTISRVLEDEYYNVKPEDEYYHVKLEDESFIYIDELTDIHDLVGFFMLELIEEIKKSYS